MQSRLSYVALCLLLAGCTQTRIVYIETDPPPPTVITKTDTLYVETAAPPVVRIDTLLARDTVVVTNFKEVIVYREPRRGSFFHLYGLEANHERLRLYGAKTDQDLLIPRDGEFLYGEAKGSDSLSLVLAGKPVDPPDLQIECPKEREGFLERNHKQIIFTLLWALVIILIILAVSIKAITQ